MAKAKVGSLSLRFPLFRVFILLLFIIHFSILIFDLILFVVDFLSISCQLSNEQDQANSKTQQTQLSYSADSDLENQQKEERKFAKNCQKL